MKQFLVFVFCLFIFVDVMAQRNKIVAKPLPKQVLKNGTDSLSYALGINIATSMRAQGIEPVNYSAMQKGMDAVFNNKPKIMDDNLCIMTIQQKMQQNMGKKMGAEKKKGKDFLDSNGKRKEVTTLPNGLQYEIVEAAPDSNVIKPLATDVVIVKYIGTSIDGQEFDRGMRTEFGLTRVITGWTQILQLMRVGDHWKVYIPSDLAYGDSGNGNAIKPGETLIFDMTLLEIKK